MRVTSNTFSNDLIDKLGSLSVRQNRLQTQAATGQRIQAPDDDPSAMRRVLDLQADSGSITQFGRNISRLQELSQASYSSIKSLQTISNRAGEIATLADGLKSPEEMKTYATEINQLIKQAVQVANSKNRGDYLFGGTKSQDAPFTVTTDADGNVTDVGYAGNTNLPETEIAEGVGLSVQVAGENTSGSGNRGLITDSRSGADFFKHLISLQQHLQAGDSKAISAEDRKNLAKDEDNLIFHIGLNGATQSRLESAAAAIKARTTALDAQVSKEVDADLSQTLVKLSETQNAYRAALQTGGTILNMSLLDYLR